MEKQLITVHVLGIMEQGNEREEIETLSNGYWVRKEDETELFYRETAEESEEEIKTHVFLNRKDDKTECRIVKSGPVNSEMLFINDFETECIYQTPFGEICFEIITSGVEAEWKENELRISLKYTLASNGIPVSEASVTITAKTC
ncbi:MAG: DUF1934 domain-containing protein [Lachnospiraceae bacterium]|nr:DUF1934 domain-containing protein [Lachnospiraceae bacterium]